ncbi:MAG: two-component system response regulator [Nitrospinae bacterium CG11_big_fil_rev_8_21_14_0_20_56_8]|nr:MAG: two-component system response regulator [Nitrospinae bacterium CG11_big_fil_rev_8_21_14_0_20_56_8]
MGENLQRMDIVVAEDDDDDFQLISEAFQKSGVVHDIHRARDGEELLHLLEKDKRANGSILKPGLILLDLNMPKKDGIEALRELKADPLLRSIPVVVLTTSKSDEDVYRTYDLGVNSFIQKPISYRKFLELFEVLKEYWFETVRLPPKTI